MKIRFVHNKRSRSRISNSQPKSSTSSDVVADNDDLLVEILVRLPIKSLLKFKCVSKHWLSIISNPQFSRSRCPASDTASGLFLRTSTSNPNQRFKFLPLNHIDSNAATRGPFKHLTLGNNHEHLLTLLQSCNGLLLCCSFLAFAYDQAGDPYVYNPTTKHFTTLPKLPLIDNFDGFETCDVSLSIAFDPSRSPHYKVMSVRSYNRPNTRYRIDIYSSNNGPWRQSSASMITAPDEEVLNFQDGVYWNGAIYWIKPSLCFHIDQEQFKRIPSVPYYDSDDEEEGIYRNVRYFGESYDHLHLIESYKTPMVQLLHIYEMERDHSAWSVKYCVNLYDFSAAFPETVLNNWYPYDYLAFAILCFIRSENDDDSFLVMHIPGKAVRYNLQSTRIDTICDFSPPGPVHYLQFEYRSAYQFIESLCCV